MRKKKAAKLDLGMSKLSPDAEVKKTYNVTMDGDEDLDDEIADIDLSPEALAKWRASLPPKVRAEIDEELNAQMSEMTQQFEKHAIEYEKAHPEIAPHHEDKGEPLPAAPRVNNTKAKIRKKTK